jgi:redox-sensitive bicupin YhaK (pirin superfamily)
MSVTQAAEPDCDARGADSVDLVIRSRPRDLGDFTVRRTLPAMARRTVGPFIFWDHMGPTTFPAGRGVDVRPHPHIGLATLTYLFDGEIEHKDSLGSRQSIRPRAVNWMVAGRGIVHSERTPEAARAPGSRLHGIQSWVALPEASEEIEPSFHHVPEAAVPVVERPGVELRIVAGAAYGAKSLVPSLSPLFDVDAIGAAGATIDLPDEYEERAAYVVEGSVSAVAHPSGSGGEVAGERIEAGSMIVFRPAVAASLRILEPSRVMLLGGAPLESARHIWWNFVSSSRERIERAKEAWRDGRFPRVPGDETEFIPLPPEGR